MAIESRRGGKSQKDDDRDVKVISGLDNRMSDGQGEEEERHWWERRRQRRR